MTWQEKLRTDKKNLLLDVVTLIRTTQQKKKRRIHLQKTGEKRGQVRAQQLPNN
jgi:hypothetical protein